MILRDARFINYSA